MDDTKKSGAIDPAPLSKIAVKKIKQNVGVGIKRMSQPLKTHIGKKLELRTIAYVYILFTLAFLFESSC